jgi:hypothetical protein
MVGRFWTRAVSVLCALALVLLSSAHRPVTAASSASDPAVAAYLALGGSLDDLCLSGGADGHGASHDDCPACTLAKSMAPGPALRGPAGPSSRSSVIRRCSDLPRLAVHSPRAPPARGPPALQLI